MFKGAIFHETYSVTYRIKFDVCYFCVCRTYVNCACTCTLNESAKTING